MKKKLTLLLLLVFILAPFFLNTALGQPPPPPPKPIPLDGGLTLLIAAGIAYGAKKLHSAQKENQN